MDAEQRIILAYLEESLAATQSFILDEARHRVLLRLASAISGSLSSGRKLLVAGNGGSAGDAQHIAGEFISRLFFDRRPLAAIALTTDTSVLTAVGNDYGYEKVFERQVLGLGQAGDVFLGISTSGASPNILRALEAARANGLTTIGFTGSVTGPMTELCDHLFQAPSSKTAIVQQIHITAAHIVCGLVERSLCSEEA